MSIAIAMILAPTLGFYVYVLAQFWREATLRHRRPEAPLPVVKLYYPRGRNQDYNPIRLNNRGRSGATPLAAAPSAFESRNDLGHAKQSKRAKVLTTYLKSRLAVLPSGTARLAVKRAAKG